MDRGVPYRLFALVSVILLLAGCGTVKEYPDKLSSYAFTDTDGTGLGRAIAPERRAHPGESGFHLLGDGVDAFAARLAFADAAERSIDAQYYLYARDETSLLLTAFLLQAADRGVRVRLLLDDMDQGGADANLAALALHPDIQIRLFNPFPSRTIRVLSFLTDFSRVSRRMHNKSFIVDNQVSIIGGRNIGNDYFGAGGGALFGDLDVIGVGPVAKEVSTAFDVYWNHALAVPAEAFVDSAPRKEDLTQVRATIARAAEAQRDSAYVRRLKRSEFATALMNGELELTWAHSQLFYDDPDKLLQDPEQQETHLSAAIVGKIPTPTKEALIVSPYFVPGDAGVEWFRQWVEQGVRVVILTNSLAANDVAVVHAGYARYRKALLEAGVELWELKPTSSSAERDTSITGSSRASLHAKTMAFDGERLFVGSVNLDPRSLNLNTEIGTFIESPELAGKLKQWMAERMPQMAWEVRRTGEQTVWLDHHGQTVTRHSGAEPEASRWQRFQAWLFSWLPVEKLL